MAHYFDGKHYYADTAFLNKVEGALPGSTLSHLGFGEFVLKDGKGGEVEFDRMRGKDFPGQSGRSHKVYDNQKGKLVQKLMNVMEKKGKSKLQTEAEEYKGAELSELQKLAGIRPKYRELIREAESPAKAVNGDRPQADHSEMLKLAGISPKYHEHLIVEKRFQVGDIVHRTTKAMRSMGIHTAKEGKVVGYSGKWPLIQWQDDDEPMPQAEAGLKKIR